MHHLLDDIYYDNERKDFFLLKKKSEWKETV